MRLLLTFISLFLLTSFSLKAQFGFVYNDSIVVFRGGEMLKLPWAGGLNYTQVSDFDYDFDGDADLLLFDRSRDNIRVLIQEDGLSGKQYRLAYNAKNSFPSDVRYRAALVDYDLDGRKDLFTYGIGGVKVYRNVGDLSNGLQWQLAYNLLYSQYPGGNTNLYVSSSDIPAYVDVDFDGDVDVLTFSLGGQHVEYHQNQSMELYGIPDSLIFELKNECWGLFSEDATTNSLILNDPNPPCVGGSIPNPLRHGNETQNGEEKKHSGSTLMAFDYDNSGVLDLLVGDVSFNNLILVLNGGAAPNTNSAMVSQDPNFPSNSSPVDMQIFPAAFFVDVDFDGIKDIIVGANAKNISENESSVLFYKNIGTDQLPTFVFESLNYFQDEMIEHGTGSVPVFFDENDDGLKDLFVANFYRYKPVMDKESTIAHYRNTGIANNPEFTYIDYNFMNLDMETYGLRTIPAFGDIDGDGDEDLFLGLENGSLVFHENLSAGTGAVFGPAQPSYPDFNGNPVAVNQFAFPQIFDLNNDGLYDIVLGAKTGEIAYYQNIGTINAPQFQLMNSTLGNVDVSGITPDGYAAPFFFRHDDTTYLFCGSAEGNLFYYDSIDGNLGSGENFNLVSNNYLGINVEGYSSFTMNDIDNDGNYNLFVGQDLGGIFHFEADPNSSVSLEEFTYEPETMLFPNPASSTITIRSDELVTSLKVYDLKGRVLIASEIAGNSIDLDLTQLSSGTYLIEVKLNSGYCSIKRFIRN